MRKDTDGFKDDREDPSDLYLVSLDAYAANRPTSSGIGTSCMPQTDLLLKIIIMNGAPMALPTRQSAPNFHAVSRSLVRA